MNKILVSIFILAVFVFAVHGDTSSYIYGGDFAKLGDFPHHVHLQVHRNTTIHICGGSLISYSWVLTAAQCVYNFDQIQASIGLVNREEGPIQHIVSIENKNYVRIHPDYAPPDVLANDLAMIYLASGKSNWLNHEHVGSIGLPSNLDSDFVDEYATATGFGRTSDDESLGYSRVLKYVTMQVIKNQACAEYFGSIITDSNLCTNATVGSTCDGDVGAGLFIQNGAERKLIGVGSFRAAIGCTHAHPAVFTRVAKYVDWIERNKARPPPGESDGRSCGCDCKCHTCPSFKGLEGVREL